MMLTRRTACQTGRNIMGSAPKGKKLVAEGSVGKDKQKDNRKEGRRGN